MTMLLATNHVHWFLCSILVLLSASGVGCFRGALYPRFISNVPSPLCMSQANPSQNTISRATFRRDLYNVLEVPTNASKSEIRNSYMKIVAVNHPDRNNSIEALELFQNATYAYGILKDAKSRSKFDSQENTDRALQSLANTSVEVFEATAPLVGMTMKAVATGFEDIVLPTITDVFQTTRAVIKTSEFLLQDDNNDGVISSTASTSQSTGIEFKSAPPLATSSTSTTPSIKSSGDGNADEPFSISKSWGKVEFEFNLQKNQLKRESTLKMINRTDTLIFDYSEKISEGNIASFALKKAMSLLNSSIVKLDGMIGATEGNIGSQQQIFEKVNTSSFEQDSLFDRNQENLKQVSLKIDDTSTKMNDTTNTIIRLELELQAAKKELRELTIESRDLQSAKKQLSADLISIERDKTRERQNLEREKEKLESLKDLQSNQNLEQQKAHKEYTTKEAVFLDKQNMLEILERRLDQQRKKKKSLLKTLQVVTEREEMMRENGNGA